MPKIKAYASVFRDWEGLLGAVDRNSSLLPAAEAHTKALQTFLERLRDVKLQQEDLAGKKRATTQSLKQVVAEGSEVARKLRAHVVSAIGSQTELLKQFGIPTRRCKSPKTAGPLPEVDTPHVELAIETTPPSNPGGRTE